MFGYRNFFHREMFWVSKLILCPFLPTCLFLFFLAHPNLKLFITHGGLLSTMETVYSGVPVLLFPVFGDQKFNAAKIQNDGYGLYIWLSKLTEENLTEALDKLLNDPK